MTGSLVLATQSGQQVQLQQQPGQQRPMQNPRMPTNPLNINQGPRPPRPSQPQWSNQQAGSSQSDILRNQLTKQAKTMQGQLNQALSTTQQKQPTLIKAQVAKQVQMSQQGNKQGSPQPVMKQQHQVQKPMQGKQTLQVSQQKPNDGNKTEADSSVGVPSLSMAPVQMQTGGQIPGAPNMTGMGSTNQRKDTTPALLNLLNQQPQGTIIRTNAPNTVSAISGSPTMTPLQQQLTRPMIPTMANPRAITPQGPGGQTIMMTRAPINIPHQNPPGTLNSAQAPAMDTQNQGIESRKVIWTGELQWKENSKQEPNTNKKMEHAVVCSVTSKKAKYEN